MISREAKIISMQRPGFLEQEIFNKVDRKRDSDRYVFFCKFCDIFKNRFFMEYLQWRLLFFKTTVFSFDILWWKYHSKNSLWCVRKLFQWISIGLRPLTLFKKSLQHRCFSANFAKFIRTSFLKNTSGQPLLDFFIHFTVFCHPVN